jgi:hypothetical protein
MVEEEKKKEDNKASTSDQFGLMHKFESKSEDPGVFYVENFHQRKIETMDANAIVMALGAAAAEGNPDFEINLAYVGHLVKGRIAHLITHDQRMALFRKAAEYD